MSHFSKLSVSIVIPCKNEERYIAKCLESIILLNYPKELLSVYICDGLSNDQTISIIKGYESNFPFLYYLENSKETTPCALNLGIKKSLSDIVIILGAHSEIYPDYILECLKAFEIDPNIGCVGGIIENVHENYTSEIIGLAMSSSFGVGNAHFRTGNKSGFVDTVAFGAYKREVFEKTGYFDENLVRNQDDEFNFRLLKGGFRIYLSHSIRSKYYVRGNFTKLSMQYFQYGYWKIFVNLKYKTVTTIRQLIPFLFVIYVFLFLLGVIMVKSLFLFLIFPLVLYFILAFYQSRKKSKDFYTNLMVVFTFVILHFSYGYGYLMGIIDFIILRKQPNAAHSKLSR